MDLNRIVVLRLCILRLQGKPNQCLSTNVWMSNKSDTVVITNVRMPNSSDGNYECTNAEFIGWYECTNGWWKYEFTNAAFIR